MVNTRGTAGNMSGESAATGFGSASSTEYGTATDAAGMGTAAGSGGGTGTGGSGGGQEQQAVGEIKEQASRLMESAREQINTRLSAQKETVAGGADTVALVLQRVADQFEQEDQVQLGGYVSSAADQVEQLADTLRTQDVSQLVDTVGNYARRQPAAFLAAAFALGFAGARFFRSSTPPRRDHASSSSVSGVGGTGTGAWTGQSAGGSYGAGGYGSTGYGTGSYGTGSGAAVGAAGGYGYESTSPTSGTGLTGDVAGHGAPGGSGFGGGRTIDGGAEMVDTDAAVSLDDLGSETNLRSGGASGTGGRGAGTGGS